MLPSIPVSRVRLFPHLIRDQHFRRHVPRQTSDILSITEHRHQPQSEVFMVSAPFQSWQGAVASAA
jgi:hypothetical protein